MRAHELTLDDLLELDPKGGVFRFAGQRTLLLDAVAMGLLREQLIALVGVTAARGVLTRFGFSHGWRTADALERALPWADVREWRIAGGRLHRLQGLVSFEPVAQGQRQDGCVAEATWHDSYEAEQHILHLGVSEQAPVCWSLCGFASGYLSRARGEPVRCVETSCVGRGDAVCAMEGRVLGDWGPEWAEALSYYEGARLEETLAQVAKRLREADARLRSATRRQEQARWGAARPGDGAIVGGEGGTGGVLSDAVVARSEAMRRAVELAERVARVDTTVLITGESGSGKERIARLIHDRSSRRGKPFVAINCGAVPESLLESELFGHAKGAFTGAGAARVGLFEAAHTGTLLLDEVGELPAPMQVRLLRVLQERQIRRLGENAPRDIDVRILAATHQDLPQMIAQGTFRQDLYYRLRVIEVHLPPLRERPEDLLPLARDLIASASARLGRDAACTLAPDAARALMAYPWPGNVRELYNAIERAVVLARGPRVVAADLPEEVARAGEGRSGAASASLAPPMSAHNTPTPSSPPPPPPLATLADVERQHILTTLDAVGGNKTQAAAALGIGVATLYRKLRRYQGG